MKKAVLIVFLIVFFFNVNSNKAIAQCSICTKTAQQLGEKPAKALNTGIIYLATMPFLIFSYIGYRWWRNNHEETDQ